MGTPFDELFPIIRCNLSGSWLTLEAGWKTTTFSPRSMTLQKTPSFPHGNGSLDFLRAIIWIAQADTTLPIGLYQGTVR